MNASRGILYGVGVGLIILSLWIFFVQTGMDRWIPTGIAIAAVIMIVGVAVMSFARKTPSERRARGRNADTHRHE